jgi:MinD superfamily P-loop ATPase
MGEPRLTDRLDWGPTIDAELCDACRTCSDFCHNGVFGATDGRVWVAEKTNCVLGCSHCATLCPQGAIAFPSVQELKRWRAEIRKAEAES